MATKTEHRVTVRIKGAPAPLHASPWGTKEIAEHSAKNHRAMIRDKGYGHVVEIETREVEIQPSPALRCDADRACEGAITHVDERGWLYCATHGPQRKRAGIRCRKLRPAEIRTLQAGKSISYEAS